MQIGGQPFVKIEFAAAERRVEHQLKERRIVADALWKRPRADQVAITLAQCGNFARNRSQVAADFSLAAEAVNCPPDRGNMVKTVGFAEALLADIQKQKMFGRNRFDDIGAFAPHLHHPDGAGVGGEQCARHALAAGAIVFGGGSFEELFVKEVDAVVANRAEELFELLQIDGHDAVEHRVGGVDDRHRREVAPARAADVMHVGMAGGKRLRNMTAETRQNRFHAKLTLTIDDPPSQLEVGVDPVLRKRSGVAVDVVHILPRQEGRAGEKGARLVVRQAETQQCALPHRLDAGHGQRHIDAAERHAVDFTFPILPAPPGQRVAEGAIVQIGAQSEGELSPDRNADLRRFFKPFHARTTP